MIERNLSKTILKSLQVFPAVYVAGPRQAGKSTLALRLAANEWPADYVTFDEATMLGAAHSNPESFLRAWKGPLILDEVQRAPGLFRALKAMVDEARLKDKQAASGRYSPETPPPRRRRPSGLKNKQAANGQYLLTGSSNILALPGLADALVGRMRVLTLYPLSALEVSGGAGDFLSCLMENRFRPGAIPRRSALADMIRRATFPDISDQDESARRQWFESYITTILQRDVRQIADIAKPWILPNLLKALAGRAGGLVNEADIARTVGLNAVTGKNYRVLLQMIFLAMDVKPWFRNIGKRLVKSPKNYLVDASLLCHLQRIDLAQSEINDPHRFGQILENFVATELVKQLSAADGLAELQHFRTSDGKGVDFILESLDGKLAAIEVKNRDAITENHFKGLKILRREAPDDFVCGIVLYRGRRIAPFDHNLWAVPVDAMWL